jgi:uncharacterized protein (DUF1697 family)
LRGINVGRAKRVSMADLKSLVEDLGYRDVRTLLNSGNVVFTAPPKAPMNAAAHIQKALVTRLGVSSRVTVITADELATIVDKNPLAKVAKDPTRLLVAFLADPADRAKLATMLKQAWGKGALALGARAAYLWCPDGLLASPLAVAVGRALGDAVTTRNWATVTKLHAIAEAAAT